MAICGRVRTATGLPQETAGRKHMAPGRQQQERRGPTKYATGKPILGRSTASRRLDTMAGCGDHHPELYAA